MDDWSPVRGRLGRTLALGFGYTAYGLRIRSELRIPQLSMDSAGAGADVVVRERRREDRAGREPGGSRHETRILVGAVNFTIRDGREIVVASARGLSERELGLYILGAPLQILLHQRDSLVIHASAVAAGDRAVIIAGDSTWGKSTTAAMLYRSGYSFICDETVALLPGNDAPPTVLPGIPALKLSRASAQYLGYQFDSMEEIWPDDERRELRIADRMVSTPVPVTRIYILQGGKHEAVERLTARDGFFELLRHAQAVQRLGSELADTEYFPRCARVADMVPVCLLRRRLTLESLPEVARLIARDIAA